MEAVRNSQIKNKERSNMKLVRFEKEIKKMHKATEDILVSKNKDYSHSEDVHSNFMVMAQFCKLLKVDVTTPEGCIQYELIKKVYRLLKLINAGVTPNHESLWDNSMDCHAYQHLLNSFITIKEEKKKALNVIDMDDTVREAREKGQPCD